MTALDVHASKVRRHSGSYRDQAVHDLVGQVMAKPDYKNAPRVFVIMDNGSDHRGKTAADRLRKAHTPVHASPLNRDLLLHHPEEGGHPNDFASLDELSRTLLAFVDRYNQTVPPFN